MFRVSSQSFFGEGAKYDSSSLVLLPVPWEVTTSYGAGTSWGPQAILDASGQLDFYDLQFGNVSTKGISTFLGECEVLEKHDILKAKAQRIMADDSGDTSEINQASEELNDWVYNHSKNFLNDDKYCGLVGGDHSVPFGAIRAHSEKYKGDFSILHIDAHHDLREAYQGFTHSHASIFYNVMNAKWRPKKLVQLGIRDFCEEEHQMAKERKDISCFYDQDVAKMLFSNTSWDEICKKISSELTENVYISCDIDGFDPSLCPNTGTPVPGGIDFRQFSHLLEVITNSKKVIGFDLVEVAPDEDDEFDGNIGARVFYKLAGACLK